MMTEPTGAEHLCLEARARQHYSAPVGLSPYKSLRAAAWAKAVGGAGRQGRLRAAVSPAAEAKGSSVGDAAGRSAWVAAGCGPDRVLNCASSR